MVFLRCMTIGLCLLLVGAAGCDSFHNLQPHRLHRLNRGSGGMSSKAYYSVEDTDWDAGQVDLDDSVTELGQ